MLHAIPTPVTQDTPLVRTAQAPDLQQILARSPTVTAVFTAAEQALAKGHITARERELIALTVAEINGSDYCLAAHTLSSRASGVDDEEIRLARNAAAHDPKSEAMLRFTQAVVLQRGKLRDNDLSTLHDAGYSDQETIELIANIALNIFTNYLSLIFRSELCSSSPAKRHLS